MMDDHRKRIVALDCTYVFDASSGHYIPEAEREEPLRYRGLVIVAGAILLWAIFFAAATFIFEALAS